MSYSTQEEHNKFLTIFDDRQSFEFHPEKKILSHFLELDKDFYVKDCVIGWLQHPTSKQFTKKECYQSIGLQKPNEAFNQFWNFLTRERTYGHYLSFDKELGKWINLY